MGTTAANFQYSASKDLSSNTILHSMTNDYETQEIFKRLKDAKDHNISLLNRHSDMMNTSRDVNSLHHAEAVIESQHMEILRLTSDIESLNTKINDLSKNECSSHNKLLEDIANLNEHIVKLESDLQISLNKSQTYLDTIKSLEDTDANQSYQMNHKLKIRNTELETKYQELLTDLYQVKEERDRYAAVQSNTKEYVKNSDISCRLRKREDIKDLAMHMCQMDDVKKKCIIQLESELLTYKNICQRQCEEIKQLNSAMEHAKNGAININGSNKMVQCLQKQILHLSNDIHMQTKLVQEYQMTLANSQTHQANSLRENTLRGNTLHENQMNPLGLMNPMNQHHNFSNALDIINETQKFELDKAVVTKFLSKIEDVAAKNAMNRSRVQILNPYYTCYVCMDICQLDGYCMYDDKVCAKNNHENVEYNVNICVCLDKIFIFNEGHTISEFTGDKSEYFELPVRSIESITFMENTFKIVTKQNTPWVHLHISTKNEDEFKRLYYSLCYNGSISNVVMNGCAVFGGSIQKAELKLAIIFYTKMQEIMGSIFYNEDFNIVVVVSSDSKIRPLIIKCDDYILDSVMDAEELAFSYYSMRGKCSMGYLYSLQRYQQCEKDLHEERLDEEDVVNVSSGEYYYLTCLNDGDIEQLDRVLDMAEWHKLDNVTEEDLDAQSDAESHVTTTEGGYEEDKSNITPFVIENGFIYLKFVDVTDESQGIDIENCFFIADASKNELSILVSGEPSENEMFIFSLPTNKDFEYWKKYLIENGVEQQKESAQRDDARLYRSNSGKVGQQACVVTKGQMQLYKNYTDDTSEPLITYVSTSTKVTINESKREIIMESMSTQGNKSRITLDCTNPKEFVRWKSALILAGFIADNSAKKDVDNGLKKYVFPIKLFKTSDTGEGMRRAFVIKSNYVALYTNSTSKNPYLLFKKADVEVLIFVNDRRIRLYIRRYTKNEERFDFVLPLMKDFSTACAEFKSFSYKLSSGDDATNLMGDKSKMMKNSKHPFVLAKPGTITLHLTMYTPEAEVTIKSADYTCDIVRNKLKIEFTPKSNDVKTLPPLVFKHENYFNKWLLTLKVAGFLRFTNEKMPKLYFPTIFYGHISPESIMLSKK